ncbi:MAG TPA: alpha-E domain-containing protein [Candidatus Sulfotelmatobacter sp.]|nr:alpha-E domain-containing protein [Candidatus Sulfotelmatobacter sp.]
MLSRVADNLYWMSRYLERAERSSRLVSVNLNLTTEHASAVSASHWRRVLEALWLAEPDREPRFDEESLAELVFSRQRHTSIFSCVAAARNNARQVREEISAEMWERINRLYLHMRSDAPGGGGTRLLEFLQSVVETLHLVQGTTDSTMSHGEGWRFIQVGQHIERAMATARLLGVYLAPVRGGNSGNAPQRGFLDWVGLLNSCSAFEPYCKIYAHGIEPRGILEFLLFSSEFPHSVRFCVDRMHTHLGDIAVAAGQRAGRAQRLTGRLQAQLNFGHVDDIMRGDLAAHLKDFEKQCLEIHDAIYQAYILYSFDDAMIA